MNIGKRIKTLRTAQGLTRYQLAKRTGLHYFALKKIEEGKSDPRADSLEKIAKALEVDFTHLFGGETRRPLIQAHIEASLPGKEKIEANSLVAVPLFADSASLGQGRLIDERNVERYILIPKDQLPNSESSYCIKVTGDSMEPVFSTGDLLAIDISENDSSKLHEAFVAARLSDGEITVKKLMVQAERFYLKALNPTWEEQYGPLLERKKDGVIVGKVVWQWRRF